MRAVGKMFQLLLRFCNSEIQDEAETWCKSSSEVVAFVEVFKEIGGALVFGFPALHEILMARDILANDVVPLLWVVHDILQLLHPLKQQQINHL